jgi:RND family efflux transporter MFP subunit
MISDSDENVARSDDENTARSDDENAVRIKVIPLEAATFNGSVDQKVQEIQADSLMPVAPVMSKQRKSKSPRAIIILAIIGVLVGLAGGIYVLKSPPRVVAYKTHMQNVNLSIGGSGIVHAGQELHVSFPLAEQVTNVYVKPGDQVIADQPLVQLDLSRLNAQVAQAAADVTAAQNYLYSSIGTPQAGAAQLAYDEAVSRYNALQAEVASPTLHNGTLVAPFNGSVVAVTVQSGDLAKANANLVTLQSDATVVAYVQIPLANLTQVFANQDALVTPSAVPNLTLHGTVTSIIAQSSAATDTFEVWVTIDNTAKQLLPGMSVFARLQEPLRTLTVPRLAVVNADQGAIVFVIKHGHVSLRHVQTGGYVGDSVVIEAGLSDGDVVALTGVDTLQDGQPIDVSKVQS